MKAGSPHDYQGSDRSDSERGALDAAAADWLVAHDRGLTAEERVEFERWLGASPRHAEAWAEANGAWTRLDRMPELSPGARAAEVGDAANRARRRRWPVMVGAAAAVLAVGLFGWLRLPEANGTAAEIVRLAPKQVVLSDGTRVELNGDSEVVERFTAGERRVRLVRGEAHFTVVTNAARPFVVEAGGVSARAVGTAFSVRLDPASVEVLVTEGRVRVDPAAAATAVGESGGGASTAREQISQSETPVLGAGQRATVALVTAAVPQVTVVSEAEMARARAWQALRLQFQDMPLDKVAAEFNRHNRVRLVVEGAAAETLVAGRFQADNVELFVHFLEQAFRVSAERRGGDTIVLRKAP